MKKLRELWATMPETVTVTRLDGILIVTISALVGAIIGMLCSPRKYVSIGCGNGANEIHNMDSLDDQVEEVDIWDDGEEIVIK